MIGSKATRYAITHKVVVIVETQASINQPHSHPSHGVANPVVEVSLHLYLAPDLQPEALPGFQLLQYNFRLQGANKLMSNMYNIVRQ